MKVVARYCKKCRKITPHDIKTNDFYGLERTFMVVVSCGISELIREEYYECQICGKKTDRQ